MTEYITVYTDGSCKGNPGPGGWACTVNGKLYSGGIDSTTNNAAELWAVYNALLEAPAHSCLLIITDSRLVIGWLRGFNGKLWRRNKEHIRTPCELIEDLRDAKHIRWAFRQVKGHAENVGNNIVDQAASQKANEIKWSR